MRLNKAAIYYDFETETKVNYIFRESFQRVHSANVKSYQTFSGEEKPKEFRLPIYRLWKEAFVLLENKYDF